MGFFSVRLVRASMSALIEVGPRVVLRHLVAYGNAEVMHTPRPRASILTLLERNVYTRKCVGARSSNSLRLGPRCWVSAPSLSLLRHSRGLLWGENSTQWSPRSNLPRTLARTALFTCTLFRCFAMRDPVISSFVCTCRSEIISREPRRFEELLDAAQVESAPSDVKSRKRRGRAH